MKTSYKVFALTFICVLLVVCGIVSGSIISSDHYKKLLILNLVLALGILLANLVNLPIQLKFLILVSLALNSGVLISFWIQSLIWIVLSLTILLLNQGLIILLVFLQVFKLDRFVLIMALLSLIFSLAGALVYGQGLIWLTLLWAGAACVCLSGLLYHAVSRVLHHMSPAQEASASLFLLNLGLLVNVVIILSTF